MKDRNILPLIKKSKGRSVFSYRICQSTNVIKDKGDAAWRIKGVIWWHNGWRGERNFENVWEGFHARIYEATVAPYEIFANEFGQLKGQEVQEVSFFLFSDGCMHVVCFGIWYECRFVCITALMHVCIDAISFRYAFVCYYKHGILILLCIIAILMIIYKKICLGRGVYLLLSVWCNISSRTFFYLIFITSWCAIQSAVQWSLHFVTSAHT